MPHCRSRDHALFCAFFVLLVAALLVAGACIVQRLDDLAAPAQPPKPKPMLLAPLVGVNDTCIEQTTAGVASAEVDPESLVLACGGAQGSAAPLIESTLARLAPASAAVQQPQAFSLGYTLAIPLLTLFEKGPAGWYIDPERVARVTRTVSQSKRPAVLYFFSTHFSAGTALEPELASNADNVAYTRDGPLPTDSYYGAPLYNWSVARTDNPLTQRREAGLQAVLDSVCELPSTERSHIQAITVLGETHQLFPDFEAGMGFSEPYRITDYSPASVQGFRQYLRQEFTTLAQLNRTLGSTYISFDEVTPPSRDIRTEPLARYTEHIDAYAHGSLPIAGWAYVPPSSAQHAPSGSAPWVHVYRDGVFIGRTRADRGRQDVAQAVAQVQQADTDTGWRMDLDFRTLAPGLHSIDVFLEQRPGELAQIGSRRIAIMDARQQTPVLLPQKVLPNSAPKRAGVLAHMDQPAEQSSYYFNPLAPLWHAFRNQQVNDYLAHFSRHIGQSCLADVPRYTHQIVPFSNPGWDANKFAIDQSLMGRGNLQLGVSLYGDAAYGARFPAWLRATGHKTYGVTEFHPLRAMDAPSLRTVLDSHAANGARFLSFFLEPHWQGALVPRAAYNPFALDPDNPAFGSDRLYRSMQQILHRD